jgi:hypothetical protein
MKHDKPSGPPGGFDTITIGVREHHHDPGNGGLFIPVIFRQPFG